MINVAKTAGFCYGVKRAVDDVYKEIENGKKSQRSVRLFIIGR